MSILPLQGPNQPAICCHRENWVRALNIAGEPSGRGWTELSSLVSPSVTASTRPHHTATKEWGKKSGCVSLPIVSCFSEQSAMTKRRKIKKSPHQNHGALWGSTASFPVPRSLPYTSWFFWSSPASLPSLGSRAGAAGRGARWWIQKHRISGEIRLSASEALSCWRGDKREKVNENTSHDRWFGRFGKERGEKGKVWGAGDRQGLGEGLVGRENGQQVVSGWSLWPWDHLPSH